MQKQFYGIDISKDKLQIATKSVDGQWQDSQITNKIDSIESWLLSISSENIHLVYEYTGTYTHRLTYCCELLSIHFTIITSKQSKGFALSEKMSSKTDKLDARMLYLYGQQKQPLTTAIVDESIHQKRQTYQYFITLKSEKQAFNNRLHALSFDPKAAPKVVESIEKMIQTLQDEIVLLQSQIYNIDEDENQRLQALITSVVGIGQASAQAIIVATNGLKEFHSSKAVAKFLGVCPSDNDSGTTVKGSRAIVKSGNTFVRTTLYMAAWSAKTYNNACKDIYTRLRAKGKPHKVAMMAVVHKLITQIFAVVKSNTLFDNNLALAK